MRSHNLLRSFILCILFLSFKGGSILAAGTYWAKVTAKATGEGTVYVQCNGDNAQNEPDSGGKMTSTASGSTNQRAGNISFTLRATANTEDYDFKEWKGDISSDASNPTLDFLASTTQPSTSWGNVTSYNEKSYNVEAVFVEKPLYYFSASAAVATGGGGTASVSPNETKSTRGARWNSESASLSSYTFTAIPATGYVFTGWSKNAENETIESNSNPYTPSITSTSTASDNPTHTTYYAHFSPLPVFYFSATATSVPAEGGIATATLASTSVMGATLSTTSATTTANYVATPNAGYDFGGWYSDAGHSSPVNTDNPYTHTVTSTSTNSASPTNTTLYAFFESIPTSITSSDTRINVGTNSAPISYTLAPEGAHDYVRFSISTSTEATIDATTGVISAGSQVGYATVTLTAYKRDHTTPAATTTVNVTIAEQVASPVITFTPVGDGATATATITCVTSDVTIHYTTDGTTPTSASTQYDSGNKPTVNDLQTLKAIAVKTSDPDDLWDDSEVAEETYSKCTTDEPEITFVGDNTTGTATVTITGAEGSETIYYTTDGSTPTTSSSTYTSPITNIAFGTTVKAIAKDGTCRQSNVVSKDIIGYSYANGSYVLLDDREDHTWAYYSGVDPSIDDGNYNTNYLGKMYSPNPRNVKITYNGVNNIDGSNIKVKVSISEEETSFIYYKTLEQGTATGEYPYQVISNPFSVRPSKVSGSSKTYYGFNGWKIVSGGEYIKNHKDGDVLNLDENIVFNNLNTNYSANCISAEIVFETTWTTANRTYVDTNPSGDQTYNQQGNYEKNFYVIDCDYSSNINASEPVTIMMVEPDGSSDYRTKTFTGKIVPNNTGVTKIENAKWEPTTNILPQGHNFTIGRGMNMSGNTEKDLYAYSTNSDDMDQTLKVESGKFINYQSYYTYPNSNSNIKKHRVVFGNDYDRAKNDNTKLTITNEIRLLNFSGERGQSNTNWGVITCKSGRFMTNVDHSSAETSGKCFYLWSSGAYNTIKGYRELNIEGGEFWHIGGGLDKSNTSDQINLAIRVKGGTIHGSIYGGGTTYDVTGDRKLIFTGGTIEGWIAGGSNGILSDGTAGQNGKVNGKSYVYIGGKTHVGGNNNKINASIGGYVYGAGCGKSDNSAVGHVTNQTNVVIADDSYVEHGVYGGGAYGSSPTRANIYILGHAMVNGSVDTVDNLTGGVYGGARQNGGGSVNIFMNGGRIVNGGLYGGSNATGTINNNVTMNINGGQVGSAEHPANIHGGGYGLSTVVTGNVDLTLGTLNQAEPGVTVYGDVYGGSALGKVNGTSVDASKHTNVTLNAGTLYGSLYGGALGDAGTAANVYAPVHVVVNGGSMVDLNDEDDIVPAVYGCNNVNGAPQSTVAVDIYGTDAPTDERPYALSAVFGGGNQAAYNSSTAVTVHNCDNSIEYVYGGGNAANVGSTTVTIWGGDSIGWVFAGGKGTVGGTAANVTGTATLNVRGGSIRRVFAGSNQNGSINSLSVNVDRQSETGKDQCPLKIGELYSGGNVAPSASQVANITIGCVGTVTSAYDTANQTDRRVGYELEGIGDFYGGARQANITGNINLTIDHGIFGRVFGGNNIGGTIGGTITVTVHKDDANTCGWYVGDVFGGGNQADYTPPTGNLNYPQVTIEHGTVSGSVYGGGNQADVKGNTVVTMTGGTVLNRIFGGGNMGNVGKFTTNGSGKPDSWTTGTGKCTVSVSGGQVGPAPITMNDDRGYVFGASRGRTADPTVVTTIDNEAYVKETDVTISGTAFITGGVYGGSENGRVRGNTSVKIQGGQIGCGEGLSEAYTDAKWTAAINAVSSGDASAIERAADDMPECVHWPYEAPFAPYDEYGALNGGTKVDGTDGHTFQGNVFGGGSGYWPYEKADGTGYEWLESAGLVEGNTYVEITGGHILTSVYGGNELTNVTGTCHVKMSGGTLGVPRTLSQIAAHPVTCYLFGAGKGDPRVHFNRSTNVGNVIVEINDSVSQPVIFGSVFGGGEDGHVLGNVYMHIKKMNGNDPVIGTWGTSYVDGNVFGAGRGFSGDALTAGVVQGNVSINISGGRMLGSIYGGGRLGSVGTDLVGSTDANYGKLIGSTGDTSHGNITINISGGTIGNTFEYVYPSNGDWTAEWKTTNHIPNTEFGTADTDRNRLMHTKGGNVFAGAMGRLYKLDGTTVIPDWGDMGKARKTTLNISGGTIKSNVYGGGEIGTVAEGTTITITGGTIGTEVAAGTAQSYTFGSVYGGGYGSSDENSAFGTTTTYNDRSVTIAAARAVAGQVNGNTSVSMSGGKVRASVYGGGELAQVAGNASVAVSGTAAIGMNAVWGTESYRPASIGQGYVRYGGYRMGNVYGGGKGSLDYMEAGLIRGNTTVSVTGGNIYHNIYGGGALGSVGTYAYNAETQQETCTSGGTTTVTVTGGTIGINGHDNGMVNGSSRGAAGRPVNDGGTRNNIDVVAWVNHSVVTIGTDGQSTTLSTPTVKGSVYGGGENGHNLGNTTVSIHSGTIGPDSGDYDHGNVYGAGCGTDAYTYNGQTYYNPMAGYVSGTATVNVSGGLVKKSVYGGGSLGSLKGKATVNITGGRINGSVYGGPKGASGATGENDALVAYVDNGGTQVNISYDTTPTTDDGSTTQLIAGSVYGGGEAGLVKGSVEVNMNGGRVKGDLYGGGALANTNIGNATDYGTASEAVTGSTYTTTVNLHGGTIDGMVFGGGLGSKPTATDSSKPDIPAYVYGDVVVKLNETVATDNCVVSKVHGCNNYNGSPKRNATVHIYKTVDNGTNVKASDKNETTFNMEAVYGGGNEAAYIPADATTSSPYKATVIIDGCSLTSISEVYGGGNAASVPASEVTVNGCYEIGKLFGGGNGLQAMDDGTENPGANVGYYTVTGTAAEIAAITANKDDAYWSTPANQYGAGTAQVNLLGGRIHHVFGGSNTKGTVRVDANVALNEAKEDGGTAICPLGVDEVYGGGNNAYMNGSAGVDLGCVSYMKEIYGGAKNADIKGDIELTITSGHFDRVFGGNNVGGTIDGSITVNIEETGCNPVTIGELYGCGNAAAYTTPEGKSQPTINLRSFTSIGRVFGGGLGAGAVVTGSPTININTVVGKNASPASPWTYNGATVRYYDDANNPSVTTSTVTLPTHAAGKIGAIGMVFGGGNAAAVHGDTYINIGTKETTTFESIDDDASTDENEKVKTIHYTNGEGADIRGNVFGGGNQAEVTGNTHVNIGR